MNTTTSDFHQELLDYEAQLALDPENPKLHWRVSLTAAAIYSQVLNREIKGEETGADLLALSERAVQAARRVVEVCPDQAYSYTHLASILALAMPSKTLDWSRLSPDDQIAAAPEVYCSTFPPEAFDLYDKALELDPQDGTYLSMMISNCLNNENYDRATDLVAHGLSINALSDSEASRYLARIERRKGNYNVAIHQFQKLFAEDPIHSDYECDLIETYRLAGRFEEMLSLVEATLEECPNAANAYNSLGKYYESQGETEKALIANNTYCRLMNDTIKRLWSTASPEAQLQEAVMNGE